MRPDRVVHLFIQVIFQNPEDSLIFLKELPGYGLDIKGLIMFGLDGERRQIGYIGLYCLQVEHGNALGSSAKAFFRADADTAEQTAFFCFRFVFYVDKVPAVL